MTTNDLENYLYNKVGFEPTEEQKVILDSDKRFVLVAGGEQAGKSMIASKFLLKKAFETQEAGLYWLVAADYERTRAEFTDCEVGVPQEKHGYFLQGLLNLHSGGTHKCFSHGNTELIMNNLILSRHGLTNTFTLKGKMILRY